MSREEPVVFALNATRAMGVSIADKLGVSLGEHEERSFEDGEHKTRPLINVRGRDVYVIQSLYADDSESVNDKLCRLLFFLGALREASAAQVTALVPYLCYARKDRQTKPRDPVTTRYVAQLFEAVGTDRLITIDVHNLSAFQNAFRIQTDHLEAMKLFVESLAPLAEAHDLVVVAPDTGGVKRARTLSEAITARTGRAVPMAFVEKHRSGGVVTGSMFVGDVQDRLAIILDDLISTGSTLARAAQACREGGASHIVAAATHGAFVGNAEQILVDSPIDRILVTNTLPPFRVSREFRERKLTIIDIAPFLADAIRSIHCGDSLVELNSTASPVATRSPRPSS